MFERLCVSDAGWRVRLRAWVVGAAAGLVGLAPAVGWADGPAGVVVTAGEVGRPQACRPGPWGDLTATRIVTETPAEQAAAYLKADAGVWRIEGGTAATFGQFLEDHDVPEGLRKALVEAANIDLSGGIVVRPTDAMLLELPTSARAAIYKSLGADQRNPVHADPFRYEAARAAEWFDHSGLPAEAVKMVGRLSYQQEGTEVFADVGVVMRALPAEADRLRLVRALTRKPGVRVALSVGAGTDAAALARYWGRTPARRAEVVALVEAARRTPGGGTIDVRELLPALPRRLLNTYPAAVADDAGLSGVRDCHWTSLNFWNDPADDRYMKAEAAEKAVTTDYARLADARYALGDLLMLISGGQGIHSCAYVADDVVYTKNGGSAAAPWMLARLSDVVAFYEMRGPVEVVGYRRK